ncbi:hypothetical protein SmJEL517_g03395 [Synchytrium microbalum]|uniref:Ubiquilin n=1 Tax=Synchytrium microbalum TaxID=1806994 RepID=A0A507C3A4_9FUNG|nr:uncharacterized protein SmJEL517_g03395 [Synchytrium microbalum]TPX33858.1 hypothetical protein SmJEL517_g03395 [Synchytrium microbalum]
MPVNCTVKCPAEVKLTVSFEESDTVLSLKEKIEKQLAETPTPTPAAQQRLIYSGRILKDDDLLSIYKIQEGNTLHMVKGAAPKAASSSTSTPSATATPAAQSTTQNRDAAAAAPGLNTTPLPNPFMANPFAALQGGAGAGGFPPMGGMPPMGMGGAGAMDPNLMANLLQNPQVSQQVSQMMQNPAFMDAMIASNPQLAGMMTPEMRAMMSSPDFARMMSDPNVVRQAMAMAPMMQQMGGMGGMGGTPNMGAMGAGAQNPFAMLGGMGAGGMGAPGARDATGTSPTAGAPGGMPPMNPALLQMLMGGGGMPFGAPATIPGQPQRPPEELYEVQLRQLVEMGFYSPPENIRALQMTGGNVDAAVEWLLSHPAGR